MISERLLCLPLSAGSRRKARPAQGGLVPLIVSPELTAIFVSTGQNQSETNSPFSSLVFGVLS